MQLSPWKLSGYASVAIRGAFSKARAHDWPVSITRDILQALYERDAIRNDAVLHAYSLDTPLPGRKDLTLAETLAASPLCLSSNDAPQKTEVVKGLLSGLTERQRQVVSLRYGLDEADRRECSLAEIAARLDMTESGVCDTLKKAAARCRRLAAKGNQPQPQHAAPHCYQPPRNERMAHKRLEQVAKLREAEQSLRERGERITGKQLAALAHVDSRVAHKYVRTHPDPDYEAVVQARQWQRLEDACAQLEVQGQPVTLNHLVRFTLVSLKEASAFLDARVGDARERLVLAYAQLQTQGLKTIGRKRLAQAAQVSQHRAELFLREQAGRASS